jgi:SAM-dependent methyltransferase
MSNNIYYYSDKIETLKDIFGTQNIKIDIDKIKVNDIEYPIIDDVIILLKEEYIPIEIKNKLKLTKAISKSKNDNFANDTFAKDIQFTFSKEWEKFPEILPEHEKEFNLYFDLIDTNSLSQMRVADFGCGIGRWSYFLKDKVKEIILLDFSMSIFVARKNLREAKNALFFMADIKDLPFRENFADFIFSLGVLHHLETDALEEIKKISKYSNKLLIFLYYKLDNRPYIWQYLLYIITGIRKILCRTRNEKIRMFITYLFLFMIYIPLIYIGKLLDIFGLGKYIPLYDFYHNKSLKRIAQDVYDRFFTRIENRYSKNDIMKLKEYFKNIKISENLPYWHFICEK